MNVTRLTCLTCGREVRQISSTHSRCPNGHTQQASDVDRERIKAERGNAQHTEPEGDFVARMKARFGEPVRVNA